ncbi:unnamed protein product [Hymenolepis diminuta]|uniref:Homeobox domain-containing protein n=1 Tax=Hymenolepis diminuta TaxID=6216 RepID=A0A564Z3V8_HYMDI|nr:unnamed protein product [Hymenolepis diminuta]
MDSKEERSKDWLNASHQRASDNYGLSSDRVENFTEPTQESGKNGMNNGYSQENQYLKPPSSSNSNRWTYAPPFGPPFVAGAPYHIHQLIPPPYTSVQPIPYHGLMAPNPSVVDKQGLHYTNGQYNYSSTIGPGQPIGHCISLSGPTGTADSATLSSSPAHWSVEDRIVTCGPESVHPPMNNSERLKTYEQGVNTDTKSPWPRCDGSRSRRASKTQIGILREWFDLHKHDPYPSAYEKYCLSQMTGMSIRQVETWLTYTRRKLRKQKEMMWVAKSASRSESSLNVSDITLEDTTE